MQRLGIGRLVTATLLVFIVSSASSATLFPFLIPLRTEITNEIAALTGSTNRGSAADLRALIQARNAIDRRGATSLNNDLQTLSTVATLLSRGDLAVTFAPLISEAAGNYFAVTSTMADRLGTNVNALPASDQAAVAQNALNSINLTLDQAQAATSPLAEVRTLSRAAIRLVAVQAVVNRLGRDQNRVDDMTAFINGQSFHAGTTTSAFFDPSLGTLSVNGTQTIGTESQSISLTLGNVRPGTTTHLLGDSTTDSYAIYTRLGTNVVGFTSSSGFAVVTVDTTAQTVSGTFSFVGTSSAGLAAPVQVSGGNFFSHLR